MPSDPDTPTPRPHPPEPLEPPAPVDPLEPAGPATSSGQSDPQRERSEPAEPSEPGPPGEPAEPGPPGDHGDRATVPPAPDTRRSRADGGTGPSGSPQHSVGGRDVPDLGVDPPGLAPHRLPARSLLGILRLRRIAAIAVPVLALGFGEERGGWPILALLLVLGVAGVLWSVVWWLRFSWGFDGQVVRTNSGVLWRRERALDVKRIQQVEVTQPLIHQVVGTAVLQVETASERAGSEIELDGIDIDHGNRLRTAILAARQHVLAAPAAEPGTPSTVPDVETGQAARSGATHAAPSGSASIAPSAQPATPPRPVSQASSLPVTAPTASVLKPSIADLARHALTGSSLATLPAVVLVVGQFLLDFVGDSATDVGEAAADAVTGLRIGVVVLALLVLVAGMVVAIGSTLLRFWEVELVRQGHDLRLTRGLTTRSTTTIPLHRLQVVTWSQNWVRRIFHAGTLTLQSAGRGQANQDNPQQGMAQVVVPWVTRVQLARVLPTLLDRVAADGQQVAFEVHAHPRAARRRLRWLWLRGLGLTFPVVAGLAVLSATRATLSPSVVSASVTIWVVAIGVLAWLLGAAQYRRLGHALDDDLLVVGRGILGATFDWMPLDRLQGVTARANWFQRRLDVMSIRLRPAGSTTWVLVRDVGKSEGLRLGRHLTAVAAGVDPVATSGSPLPDPRPHTS